MNRSSSFGTYETARILVPGFYFAVLLLFFARTILERFLPELRLETPTLFILFLTVTVVAGLTMYAKETTKRRKAFQENQPSLYLKTKARTMSDAPTLEEAEARRLYFYILNNHIPQLFHEKIFFFGTIYHIMIQIRRTSFWLGIAGITAIVAATSMGTTLAELQGGLAFTAVVWLVYLLNVRYNKADRKMQENYQDQITWLEINNDLVESLLRKQHSTSRPSQ